ncbi:MAG: GDYXXLXY domain-containing protein [Rubrivivax sp.]|nr:GDYXXLXY domain-containing protein [Rubrivivax sp.]
MTAPDLEAALQRAVRRGLLPAGTSAPASDSRPWPVVLLTALGAWLSTLPLLLVVGLLLGDLVQRGVGPYLIGGLLLAVALVVLRSRSLPVFVEQLALPALLVGLLALGMGLFRDLDRPVAPALLSLLCLSLAVALPRPWLRVLLGAAAALACAVACAPRMWTEATLGGQGSLWLALHAVLGLWLLALAVHPRLPPRARAALESVQAGWLLATLAGLAWWSGMTFLVGASLGGGIGGDIARGPWQTGRVQTLPMQGVSLLLAAAAASWAARQWPPLRRAWCATAAVALAALAALMPALGACLLALALTASTSRWRLAAAAALAAAWTVGAFYYALAWPLQLKALVLLGTGALLGGVAVWAWRAQQAPAAAAAPAATGGARIRGARIGLALSTLALLAVVNGGIWQKQTLIAQGQPLFVELVPVDPRSLMQGDYMALRFALPALREPEPGLWQPTRPRVLARRDARGVATLHALAPGATPAPAELLIELTPRNGDWVLVTDAWFFAEGEAARWAAARYGEFRVDGSGRALLVGLRGAQLQPL